MDSGALSQMYAQITRGVKKEDSRFVTDEESSKLWDQITSEVEEIRKKDPKAQFDIPNEVPTPDEPSETTPDSEGAADTATDAAPAQSPAEETTEPVDNATEENTEPPATGA